MEHDQRLVVGRAGPTLIHITSVDLTGGRKTHELRLLSLAPGAVFVETLRMGLTYEAHHREDIREKDVTPPALGVLAPGTEEVLLDVAKAHERVGGDRTDCTLTVEVRIHSAEGAFAGTFKLGCDVMLDALALRLPDGEGTDRPKTVRIPRSRVR